MEEDWSEGDFQIKYTYQQPAIKNKNQMGIILNVQSTLDALTKEIFRSKTNKKPRIDKH